MAPKYQQIYQELVDRIRSGSYQLGEQLPTCRELAAKCEVSYITASKALNLLAQNNYVDLDHGRGSFVRWREAGSFPTRRRITLYAPPVRHPFCDLFLEEGARLLRERGWEVRTARPDSIDALLEQVRDVESYSMVFGYWWTEYADMVALCAAGRERLVMVNERYERFGISSSCVDNSQVMQLAMGHLRGRGYRKIGLLCSTLAHGDEMEYAAVWQSFSSPEDGRRYLLDLHWQGDGSMQQRQETALTEWDRSGLLGELDALIVTDDSKALTLANHCFDRKRRIPEDLALVAVNNSELTAQVRPRLTVIDTALAGQIAHGVEMLEEKVSGNTSGLVLRLCRPQLIVRESS